MALTGPAGACPVLIATDVLRSFVSFEGLVDGSKSLVQEGYGPKCWKLQGFLSSQQSDIKFVD